MAGLKEKLGCCFIQLPPHFGPDRLHILEAFLTSSREYTSEPKVFTEAWAELGTRLKKGGFGSISHKEWQRLDAEMKKKDYPAVHHSEQYNKANKPAYRIITLLEAQRIIPN